MDYNIPINEYLAAVGQTGCLFFGGFMSFYLPILIVVVSNAFYHIAAKSAPENINTFAALSVTYIIAAAASTCLYFITCKEPNLAGELQKINWSSIVLGIAVVGLEAGFLIMYRVGWDMSTGQLVSAAALEIVLIVIGGLIYKEALSVTRLAGIAVCLLGLYLISK